MRISFCFFSIMRFVSWLSFFHITLANLTSSKLSLCHDDERYALLHFKESLIIDNTASLDPSAYNKVKSRKAEEESSDCCSWDGVKCNEDTGHVIKLNLTSSFLYGFINSSSSLFHLVHLEWLSLADNHFNSSKIPSEIINLSKLSYLNLSYSVFSGQIPSELLELSKLETLDLSRNVHLELQNPTLKSLVRKLNNLKLLNLNRVDITSSIPHTLAHLSSLTYLSLRHCQLQGTFPSSMGNLTQISYLDISSNHFFGQVPYFLGNLTRLKHLSLDDNMFSGYLPNSIGYLGSLEELSISKCNFSGQLPSSFVNLTQLNLLHISYNNFFNLNSCSLFWISKLTKLVNLDLSGLHIVGNIPSSFKNLTQLTSLVMNSNHLAGRIPVWLMNLTQLAELDLSSNQLQGSIPNSITQLKNLQNLYLDSNNLNGTVNLDTVLVKLKSLEVLFLSSNKLSVVTTNNINTKFQNLFSIGLRSCNLIEFPNFLRDQDDLRQLDLSSNNISGEIPGWLLNVSIHWLTSLNLSHNLLTGFDQRHVVLPWTTLLTLDLSYNKLQGSLPLPPKFISHYLVSNNKLTGKIPSWICNLFHLQALDLSNNNLSGVLPKCLGNFSDVLTILELRNNTFSGCIPQTFMSRNTLRMIDLSSNLLNGSIPRSLANCTRLEFLNLGNNQLTDIFPFWLGTLPELQVIILQSNRFYGVIKEPEMNFQFLKLRIIDLSQNQFTGELPSKYFQCWNAMKVVNTSQLTYMQDELQQQVQWFHSYFSYRDMINFQSYAYSLTLSNKGTEIKYEKVPNLLVGILFSNNEFTGEIPPSIANLKGLQNLNLSNNNLFGKIPLFLGNLRELESLDLSNNRFSGQIPQQLAELSYLSSFNVSHNLLTGPIPQGKQFDTFSDSSFDGNPGLCGQYISRKCSSDAKAPQEEDQGSRTPSAFDWKIALIGYAGGTIIGVVLGHTFTTRKHGWFAMICERQLKIIVRNRGHRR